MDVASKDERSQDQIPERLVLGDGLFEPVVEDLQDFDVGLGDGGDVDGLARQHRQIAHEPTAPVYGDHTRPLRVVILDDPDMPVQHDEQTAVAVPLAEQHGTLGQPLALPEPREQPDLLVGEPRVGAIRVGGLGQVREPGIRRTARRHSTTSSSPPARSNAR